MKVAAQDHGLGLIGVVLLPQSARDPLLVFLESLGGGFVHLKGAFPAVDSRI